MYKVGMYGGSFNPLHLGHINCIIQASNQCDKLYVVLSHSDNNEEIPYQHRFRWLTQLTKDMVNVTVVQVKDNSTSKDVYDWQKGSNLVKSIIQDHIDVVFCGDDYCNTDNPFKTYYPSSEIVYIGRNTVPISSTDIRRNPYKYWDYIADVAKPYFVKKIMITGSESCGKSTLVRNLAKYYNTSYVEEKGREVCDFAGGIDNMIPSDYIEILHTHKVSEIEEQRKANKLLFVDTDCMVTDYYLKLQFENTSTDINKESELASAIGKLNKYDLILFMEDDVPWIQDGTRTYGEEAVRRDNTAKLRNLLDEKNIKYYSIPGDYQQKFIKSIELIEKINNKY